MDQRVTADCVANARALAPTLAAAAARIEAGRELPPDIVDALHEARLFRMLVPRAYGGDEVSPVAFMQAIEELAKADASTAWCVAQTSVCSTISSSLKPNIAAEIFKNDPRGVLAWGPSTSKNAKAVAEPGRKLESCRTSAHDDDVVRCLAIEAVVSLHCRLIPAGRQQEAPAFRYLAHVE